MASAGPSPYTVELVRRQLVGELFGREVFVAEDESPLHCAEMTRSPPEGISVGAKDDNLFTWEVMLVGPPGTPL